MKICLSGLFSFLIKKEVDSTLFSNRAFFMVAKSSFSNRLIISSYTFTKLNSSAFSPPNLYSKNECVIVDPPIFCYTSHPHKKELLCLSRQEKRLSIPACLEATCDSATKPHL